jgi:tRNA(Ile)-lysidine synthase
MNGALVNKKIAEAILRLKALPDPGRRFVLAVSGGPDSQCLLKAFPHVLRDVWPEAYCTAVGVNHGLRPEAEAELELARALALSQEVPFSRVRVTVPKGPSLMAQARTARYTALRAQAGREGYVVTAHHFDDRAETVLIRLLRGTSLGALAVMPELSAGVFRPMLQVRREEIDAYVRRWHLVTAQDPSNSDSRYLRTRVRHELLPLMEQLSPRIRETLNAVSDEVLTRAKDPQDAEWGGTTSPSTTGTLAESAARPGVPAGPPPGE